MVRVAKHISRGLINRGLAGTCGGVRAGACVDLQRIMIRAEFIRPLSGKRVVFTGRLRAMTRDDAQTLAIRLGGTCENTVDPSIDLLVVGSQDQRNPKVSEKETAARKLRSEGKPIRILDEDEFLGLVVAK